MTRDEADRPSAGATSSLTDGRKAEEPFGVSVEVDFTRASVARVDNYLAGGWVHFSVDRELADRLGGVLGGIEAARGAVGMQRSFLVDTVCRLAAGGVGQFLELGCGVPAPEAELVHQAAQREMPSARVVYVVDDPAVLAHAQQFLRSGPDGATGFVPANLTDTERIVAHAAATLDLAEPVAVLAVGVPHHLTDQDDPHGAVTRLLDAVAPGSYLVVSHLTGDLRPEPVRTLADIANDMAGYRLVPRSHSDVCGFFDGLDLEDSGVAPLEDHLGVDAKAVGWAVGWAGLYYAGVGRKPGGRRP